jgi:hypothetical protein
MWLDGVNKPHFPRLSSTLNIETAISERWRGRAAMSDCKKPTILDSLFEQIPGFDGLTY